MEDNSKKQDNKITQEQPTDDKQQTTDELKTLEAELEKCKKQAEEYLNGWKRAKADYINFKKESEAASADLAQFAAIGVLLKILPVYDGLKKACATASEGDKWAEGILHIKKQFEKIFEIFGVKEIKTIGEKFNPKVHEAVSKLGNVGGVERVTGEISGGYEMNGEAIIPAKVIVSDDFLE